MNKQYLLLAVDDDPDILRTNQKYLSAKGYDVHTADCAEAALEKLKDNRYSCILLDVMLPDMNGFALCETIRNLTDAPILFISCLDGEEDKIKGLISGGDDYITKPYSMKEMAARVYAQVRRKSMKDFFIDRVKQMVYVENVGVALSGKEFDLFLYLFGNPDTLFGADSLYGSLWDAGKKDEANTVAVHIKRLREKLAPIAHAIGEIETVRGEGYRFKPAPERKVEP